MLHSTQAALVSVVAVRYSFTCKCSKIDLTADVGDVQIMTSAVDNDIFPSCTCACFRGRHDDTLLESQLSLVSAVKVSLVGSNTQIAINE